MLFRSMQKIRPRSPPILLFADGRALVGQTRGSARLWVWVRCSGDLWAPGLAVETAETCMASELVIALVSQSLHREASGHWVEVAVRVERHPPMEDKVGSESARLCQLVLGYLAHISDKSGGVQKSYANLLVHAGIRSRRYRWSRQIPGR